MARPRKFDNQRLLDAVREAVKANDGEPVYARAVAEAMSCTVTTALRYLNGCLDPSLVRVTGGGTKRKRVRWTYEQQ